MRNLSIRPGVHLTPTIIRTIELMDRFFDDEPSEITSGLRTTQEQLAIILKKVAQFGIDSEFPEFVEGVRNQSPINMTVHIHEIERDLYWWQRAWSKLLNIGYVVNPPYEAEVMFDYYRPGNDVNRKGEVIMISNHSRGHSFDIGGGNNLLKKSKRVLEAVNSGECFIKNWLHEARNNSVHIDCLPVGYYTKQDNKEV